MSAVHKKCQYLIENAFRANHLYQSINSCMTLYLVGVYEIEFTKQKHTQKMHTPA